MPDDLGSLTAAVAAGDSAAIAAFYRARLDWLYAEARRFTGRDESFCLDVVQEATLRIVRCLRRVESEPRLRAWLQLVVKTTAYDLLKRERRQASHVRELSRVVGDEALVVRGSSAGGEGSIDDADRSQWLAEQLAKLDPQIVRLIELRYHSGWTLRRIAEHLGLSVGTIDGRLRRALQELRENATEMDDA